MDNPGKGSSCWRVLGTPGFPPPMGTAPWMGGNWTHRSLPRGLGCLGNHLLPLSSEASDPQSQAAESGAGPATRKAKLSLFCQSAAAGSGGMGCDPAPGEAAIGQGTAGTAHRTTPSPKDLTTEQRSFPATRLHHQQISYPEVKVRPLWLLTQVPQG